MQKIINNRWLLWVLLTIPSIPLVMDFIFDVRYYAELMHESGVLASQFLVVTLLVTPMQKIAIRLPAKVKKGVLPIIKWFLIRRRYFGVAAFAYGVLHTLFYIRVSEDLDHMLIEAMEFEIALGWIAFVIFLLLAVTSNDASVKKLGSRWKSIHRWTYISAIATFVHWFLLDFFLWEALLWFVPVAFLQCVRVVTLRK